jgi:DNA processing protein
MDDLADWIRLTKTGASARRLNRLLDHFGHPAALFAASAGALRAAAACSQQAAERLLDPIYAANDRDFRLMDRLRVRLIPRGHEDYPPLLAQIPDPPVALYVRGALEAQDQQGVAIVGSRRADDYCRRTANRLAQELVEAGLTVISGLARGVDTAAHLGALEAGGRTLACLGCGVDVAYPYENAALAGRIAENGAVLSEYPMTAPPDAWHFPSRNRIVSGLSLGVIVLEAPIGSGALITAECAVDQNREVFAIPGNIDNYRHRGAHALLKDGARLVEGVEDVLAELNLQRVDQPALPLEGEEAPPPVLEGGEARLFDLLHGEPQAVDDLIHEVGLSAAAVNAALVMLEVKGLARRLPGNAYIRL